MRISINKSWGEQRMKKSFLAVMVTMFVLLLAACGDMSESDVVNKLASNLDEANSYLSTGVMEVESEGQIHEYFVEVAFMQPHYYRVTMRNETTGNEQVIVKNEDGVFVLTPALNKQFKFQSDWPLTSSQIYLYQSLLADILNSEEAVFTVTEDAYSFDIEIEGHSNQDLVRQVISFDKKTLIPTIAQMYDAGDVVRMSMRFDSFEWSYDMDESFFNVDAIMKNTQETMGEGVVSVVNVAEAQLYPTYLPDGTSLVDKTTVATDGGERVIMTFSGDQVFTIIQETARVRETMNPEFVLGEPVLVNGTVGAISDNTLTWVRDGVEFFLVSETMDRDGLVTVASSIGEAYNK